MVGAIRSERADRGQQRQRMARERRILGGFQRVAQQIGRGLRCGGRGGISGGVTRFRRIGGGKRAERFVGRRLTHVRVDDPRRRCGGIGRRGAGMAHHDRRRSLQVIGRVERRRGRIGCGGLSDERAARDERNKLDADHRIQAPSAPRFCRTRTRRRHQVYSLTAYVECVNPDPVRPIGGDPTRGSALRVTLRWQSAVERRADPKIARDVAGCDSCLRPVDQKRGQAPS